MPFTDQNNSLSKSCHFHIRDIRRTFVISFLFLQLQRLPIHASPANLIIAIHSTMAFRKLTWTKYSAYKIFWLVSLQIHPNLNTLHQYSKNYIGFQSNSRGAPIPFLCPGRQKPSIRHSATVFSWTRFLDYRSFTYVLFYNHNNSKKSRDTSRTCVQI